MSKVILNNQAASPGTPASGKVNVFTRTTTKKLASTDDAGLVTDYASVNGMSGWIDVTQVGTYVVTAMSTGASAAANTAALNAILAAAPSGYVIYTPPGFFPLNGNITWTGKFFRFQGAQAGVNGNATAWYWTSDVAGDLITLPASNFYTTFHDMNFITSVSQTVGDVVQVNSNAYVNFYRCVFSGLANTTTLKNCINYSGAPFSGELSIVDYCQFTNFSGTAIINGENLSTLCVDHCTINGGLTGTTQAVCGINLIQGGALLCDNTDIISCTNNVLMNPTVGLVLASCFFTNCFFDNANGACVKITGAGATVRTKFSSCSMTVSAIASPATAIEVSSTFAYGATGQGLDIVNCNILNTFGSAGVGTGIAITGAADFTVEGNNIAAWATGVAITPASSAGMTQPLIIGNSIAPSGGYAGNTTGISLAVGSFTYGLVHITGNVLVGNTTPIVDASTVASAHQKVINQSTGMANPGMITTLPTAAQSLPASATTLMNGSSIPVPTNGLLPGMKFRWDVNQIKTSAAGVTAWTGAVKFGTANTTADTAINSFTSGVNTAAIDTAQFSIILEITAVGSGSSATCKATCLYIHNLAAATGLSVLPVAGTPTAFNSTLASPFLHLDITHGALIVATGTCVGYQVA